LQQPQTYHIHIQGQVQGVGFRPFVYQLAHQFGIKTGWVNNGMDGVHLEIAATAEVATQFYEAILQKAPRLSIITDHSLTVTHPLESEGFHILDSSNGIRPRVLLTPDFAMCPTCQQELHEPSDRRYQYPFITCTNCGPRYSIIRDLPYDRVRTTMASFPQCHTCEAEYTDPMDRRYYSQTNSCHDCGIAMQLWSCQAKGTYMMATETAQILDFVIRAWKDGQIVAIKGIGGYLLTCDASNHKAIRLLRQRKKRPTKPLAVMYPNLEMVQQTMEVSEEAEALLQGPVAPIMLLPLHEKSYQQLPVQDIAPDYDQLGVMLPYMPLYDLLLQQFQKPIIATSGNLTNEPIVFKDEAAMKKLRDVADFILVHNRPIVIPQDDSVMRITPETQQPIIIRRSRGLAPTYVNSGLRWPANRTVLATGALLKGALGLLDQGSTYISQYLGDLDQFDAQEAYRKVAHHLVSVLQAKPDQLLCDEHPDYFSTLLAEELAVKWNVPLTKVQHHIAHFAAILGEHQLLDTSTPVLGVCFDGTGLGRDGAIWGGEFFRYADGHFQRERQFEYFEHILGDKMAKEPRVSALVNVWDMPNAEHLLREKFNQSEWFIYNKFLQRGKGLKTSSVGRLFDGVASIVGIIDKQDYEGHAAALLEQSARAYWVKNGWQHLTSYLDADPFFGNVPTRRIMEGVLRDKLAHKSTGYIALRFHLSIVAAIRQVAKQLSIKHIACSGGVFQNAVLVDLLQCSLQKDYTLCFHKQLSPNDENIPFGQLVYWKIQQMKAS
jgi:hydrogenase maturation protein HypF